VQEIYACDKCEKAGERYELTFPDGQTLMLDRCEQHATKLSNLRDEPGTWKQETSMNRYHKKDLDALLKQVRTARSK
jgi:hypothetical protein